MQIGNPEILRLIALIPCFSCKEAEKVEKELHRKFKSYRIRGEWFSRKIPLKDIRDDIEIDNPYEIKGPEKIHMQSIMQE